MDMSFLNGDTRQALTQALDQIASTHPPAPRLMTLLAGRAQAALGDVETCVKMFIDLAQFVVPHFENAPLIRYLGQVPKGLAGCLIPPRFRNLAQPSCYFPLAACRQLLLKSISERCCTLPALSWRNDFFQHRPHHLSVNYANLLSVRHFQTEWQSFQQEIQYLFLSLEPLDAQDVEHLQDLFYFLHENGLQTQADMPLDIALQLFFNNAVAAQFEIVWGPHSFGECATWYPLFMEWIFIYSAGWPNRQLYTALAAFMMYSYIKGRIALPLKGMAARKMSPSLDRAFRLAKLDSMSLFANSEQSQFRAPTICWLDLKDRHICMPILLVDLCHFDVTAYPTEYLVSKVAKYVTRNAKSSHQPLENFEQAEAYFFTQLAEAESSYQRERFSDTLTVLLELLANTSSFTPPHQRFFLHPKLVMPELYLLLAKTLAQLYASDQTILACFQQARQLLDKERPQDENSGLAYKLDDQFAVSILVVLNLKGLLQQGMAFFQHVMEENGPMLLKQSSTMHAFCVEYIQNTAFAWLDNQLAWLVGFNQFHKNCNHSYQELLQENGSNTKDLIVRMLGVINEQRDLIAFNQRFVRSGHLSRQTASPTWGSCGQAGQETTLECLSQKANFYEWMVRFIGMTHNCLPWNQHHLHQLCMLMKHYDTWVKIVPVLHPLRLETCQIKTTLECIWEACTDHSINRERHSTNRMDQFKYMMDMVEARSGTRFSQSLGNAYFQIYVWLSVGCAFSGNGRSDAYSLDLLKKSGLCLLKTSRGFAYRLPLISLLVNHLGWCHKLQGGSPDNTVFPTTNPELNCQCKMERLKAPIQSHRENHSPQCRKVIEQGFRSLDNFPLADLLATRRTRPPLQAPFNDAHNVFLLNRLLKSEDGPLIAKAVHFSTCASLRAWKGGHLGCTNM